MIARPDPAQFQTSLKRLKREMPMEMQVLIDDVRGRRLLAERNARKMPTDLGAVLKWAALYEVEDLLNGAD